MKVSNEAYSLVNFILADHDMPKKLVGVVDKFRFVDEVKHAYEQDYKAEQGVEF